MELILIIIGISLIIMLKKEIKVRKEKLFSLQMKREIQPKNKIIFAKLQKQYLNNCSVDDVADLVAFSQKYYLERVSK